MTVLLVGWAVALSLLALSVTQWVGFDRWRPVAVLQSLSFQALPCAAPVTVAAVGGGAWALAAVALAPLLTWGWLVLPALRARRPAAAADAHTITVFFGNLWAHNPTVPAAMDVVATCGADLLVLTEFTPAMHHALDEACGVRYPHRIEDVRPDPAGIAVWSNRPVRGDLVDLSDRPSIDVTVNVTVDVTGDVGVDGGDTPLRIIGVHTEPPTMRAREWSRELGDIGDLAEGADMVIGDFNAARWHPSFRALLARGWTTAHEWLGVWWRNSWANDGRAFPLFIRIDHALLRDHVRPVEVREVPLPGSDHRGFVLTVSISLPEP